MANLLLVDDNIEASRPLAMLLRFVKHQVDCAASGAEALAHLENKLPDLVILDVMMPGMDGMEVLRRMRADPRTCAVPVVMFSAVSDPEYQAAAMAKGADDYLVKGVEFQQIQERIEHWSQLRHPVSTNAADCSKTDVSPAKYH